MLFWYNIQIFFFKTHSRRTAQVASWTNSNEYNRCLAAPRPALVYRVNENWTIVSLLQPTIKKKTFSFFKNNFLVVCLSSKCKTSVNEYNGIRSRCSTFYRVVGEQSNPAYCDDILNVIVRNRRMSENAIRFVWSWPLLHPKGIAVYGGTRSYPFTVYFYKGKLWYTLVEEPWTSNKSSAVELVSF